VNTTVDKQPRNSDENVLSTSHKQPLSNAVNRAATAADVQPSNADEKGPSTSSEQPFNRLVKKGDADVDKQTSDSVEKSPSIYTEINSSKGSGTLPSASSQRRLQADDTVRSNNKLGHNNCAVCQRSNEERCQIY